MHTHKGQFHIMFVGAIEDKLTRNSCMGDMYNSIPSVCSNRFFFYPYRVFIVALGPCT